MLLLFFIFCLKKFSQTVYNVVFSKVASLSPCTPVFQSGFSCFSIALPGFSAFSGRINIAMRMNSDYGINIRLYRRNGLFKFRLSHFFFAANSCLRLNSFLKISSTFPGDSKEVLKEKLKFNLYFSCHLFPKHIIGQEPPYLLYRDLSGNMSSSRPSFRQYLCFVFFSSFLYMNHTL